MDMKNLNWKMIAIYAIVFIVLAVIALVVYNKLIEPALSKSKFSMKPTAVAPSATPAPVASSTAPAAANYGGSY
jgi:hypothetical protein